MSGIKTYTDLSQSKKLAEILPIESADMYYWCGEDLRIGGYRAMDMDYDIPCWSLAALLGVLRIFTMPTAFSVKVSIPSLFKTENGYKLTYTGDYAPMINNGLGIEAPIESVADNPVDACYNLIMKLHELKLQ